MTAHCPIPPITAYFIVGAASDAGNENDDVAVLVINLSENVTFHVTLDGLTKPSSRHAFVMTASSLASQHVKLNGGATLRTGKGGEIPDLRSKKLKSDDKPLVAEPHTYAFYVLKGVKAQACAVAAIRHASHKP
jgi:hypothetical protein